VSDEEMSERERAAHERRAFRDQVARSVPPRDPVERARVKLAAGHTMTADELSLLEWAEKRDRA
jgi:hypothetical protein